MSVRPTVGSDALGSVRAPVDAALGAYLDASARDLGRIDVHAPMLVEEIVRLVLAGGKRLRPAFCLWGYRAALVDGDTFEPPDVDEPIVRVAAAVELLHTMALIHDDLMDAAAERRGVPSSARQLAGEALGRGLPTDPDRFGDAAALLAGDLAAVLADRLFLTSGFDAPAIVRGLVPYHEMRLDMAAGQLLDVAGLASDPESALHAARLKGGSYTIEGPLMVGAALAADRAPVRAALRAFGAPLGQAFQLRDDLIDDDGARGATASTVNELVALARSALRDARLGAAIEPDVAAALDELAAMLAIP